MILNCRVARHLSVLMFLCGSLWLAGCGTSIEMVPVIASPTAVETATEIPTASPTTTFTVPPAATASSTATSSPTSPPAASATATAPPATATATEEPTAVPTTTVPPALAPECEVLNAAECLLPYPSSHFLESAGTPTGYAVRIPQSGIARVNGPTQIPASMFDDLDGFSPGSQILMHFPQGVDPAASGASRLLEPQCCGQPPGPPWIHTRTYDGRSLEVDSPTVLLDADTGERVLHFIENDARAADPARRITFLRPARILTPGHRYIVAVRRLVAPDGSLVQPEEPFRLLRDALPAEDPRIESRREHFETEIFPVLDQAGIGRADLVLAFDFVVASDAGLQRVMLAMRDLAYAWLGDVEADPDRVTFTVNKITENDCARPDTTVWRVVNGYFDVPLFLTGPINNSTVPRVNFDAEGKVAQNGTIRAPFTVSIPCALEPAGSEPSQALMIGHGAFLTGQFFAEVFPTFVSRAVPVRQITVATDWRGLASSDLGWIPARIFGLGESQLHNIPAFIARLQQGMVNTLVLTRMVKRGLFHRSPAFRRADGRGLFPGPEGELGYFGVSLGGIMGTYLASLTPDIHRYVLDVPAANFACMLQRASPFAQFDDLLQGVGVTDPMHVALGIALFNELWAAAEPVGTIYHVTADPLPGAGEPKQLLYAAAWLDGAAPNVCTEIAARSLNLPVLAGSIQQGLEGMPDVAGPVPSAVIFHDLGELDVLNPAHQQFLPPLANQFSSGVCDPHSRHVSSPATIRQAMQFLQTGLIENTCTGLCDGDIPDERPLLGECEPPAP